MKRSTAVTSALLVSFCFAAAPSFAQKKKQPAVGTSGSAQMAGGVGLFGTTYTVANSGGYVYNVSVASAEYSTARFNVTKNSVIIPKVDEKLLILHLRMQNPQPGDAYVSSGAITFSTVGLDDITRDTCSDMRLASAKDTLHDTLKPGQKFPEEVLVACTVPAVGPVPKLILNMGRKGTSDSVIRFFLGKSPNIVKPLPAAYSDPTDHTGATAPAEIPAKIGVNYTGGYYDYQVTSVAYVPGPIGTTTAGDGNQLFVVTMVVNNKAWRSEYTNGFVDAKLTTDDDEKTNTFVMLKGKRDEVYEGRDLDAADTMTVRLVFTIPTKAKATKLRLAEILDNTNQMSHALLFDVSKAQ